MNETRLVWLVTVPFFDTFTPRLAGISRVSLKAASLGSVQFHGRRCPPVPLTVHLRNFTQNRSLQLQESDTPGSVGCLPPAGAPTSLQETVTWGPVDEHLVVEDSSAAEGSLIEQSSASHCLPRQGKRIHLMLPPGSLSWYGIPLKPSDQHPHWHPSRFPSTGDLSGQ